jgi:hypothetical protein
VPEFVTGASLSAAFYAETIAPALDALPHAAGLLGPGSDVLGYDTARSTDHDWGPRATILVAPDDIEDARRRVARAMPAEFRGWPTAMGHRESPTDEGTPVVDHVWVDTVPGWSIERLGVDATRSLDTIDWLVTAQQHLLEVTAGPVFHDEPGVVSRLRSRLAWYPDTVWWWLLACQWRRLAQEEAFVQRTAEVGDELGAAVVAARLTRDAMRLALLMARRYAPYGKWLGTAFHRLPDPDGLGTCVVGALHGSAAEREAALAGAYERLARRHHALPGALPLDPGTGQYFDRPAKVLFSDRFADDCRSRANDPVLASLPLVGGVDQLCDSADALSDPTVTRRLRPFYRESAG